MIKPCGNYLFKDVRSMISSMPKLIPNFAFHRPAAPHFTGAKVYAPITDEYGTSVQIDIDLLDSSSTGGVEYEGETNLSKKAKKLTQLGKRNWFALYLRGMYHGSKLKKECKKIIYGSTMPDEQKKLAKKVINAAREDESSGKVDDDGTNKSISFTYWIPKSQPARGFYR
jgi:hypothetical protein